MWFMYSGSDESSIGSSFSDSKVPWIESGTKALTKLLIYTGYASANTVYHHKSLISEGNTLQKKEELSVAPNLILENTPMMHML